jgi:hypothetical protein
LPTERNSFNTERVRNVVDYNKAGPGLKVNESGSWLRHELVN